MRGSSLALLIVIGGLLVTAANTFFIVPETKQAVVLQFGEPKNVVQNAGLNMKLPFFQNVIMFDKRILGATLASQEVPDRERRRLNVDAFVRYRIVEPLKFYQTLNNEQNAKERMLRLLASSMRNVVATETIFTLLSEERSGIMSAIRDGVATTSRNDFGIEVIDVRIIRADLPEQNVNAILDRMVAEREREAKEARAEGVELQNRIQSNAEREREVLLADARKRADILRGEGDALRNQIYASAYSRDPDFFAFYRSMLAYEAALGNQDTTMVISPDTEFFQYLKDDGRR